MRKTIGAFLALFALVLTSACGASGGDDAKDTTTTSVAAGDSTTSTTEGDTTTTTEATTTTTTPATSAKKKSPMRPTHTHSFIFSSYQSHQVQSPDQERSPPAMVDPSWSS